MRHSAYLTIESISHVFCVFVSVLQRFKVRVPLLEKGDFCNPSFMKILNQNAVAI